MGEEGERDRIIHMREKHLSVCILDVARLGIKPKIQDVPSPGIGTTTFWSMRRHFNQLSNLASAGIWVFIRMFTAELKARQECLFPLCTKGNAYKSHFLSLGDTTVSLAKFLTSGLLMTNSGQITNLHHYSHLEEQISFGTTLLFSLSPSPGPLPFSLTPEFIKVDNEE